MSEIRNIPILRFPTFSDEWEKMRFSDFISYTKGFAFKSKDYQNDGVRIVRVSDLGYDSIKSSHGIYLDKSKVHSVEKYVIDEGDIIVTTVGSRPELIDSSVGRGILVRKNGEGLLNQNLVKINKCEKIKNKFLFGFFNTKKYFNYITQIQRGNANQSNITLKEFFNYQVSIPSLPEQQKIADFLTAVDKRIELLEKKKTLFETYKKGVMKKIFNQEIRFKDDNGNNLPDWEETTLGKLAKITTGDSNRSDSESFGEYMFFDRSVDVRMSSTYSFDTEAIIVAGEGKDFIPRYYNGKFGLHQRTYAIYDFSNSDAKFLYYWIYYFRYFFLKTSVGSTMPSLRMNSFTKFPVSKPTKEEQVKISKFLSSIDNQIELLETQINKSKNWKKGLLQKMFV